MAEVGDRRVIVEELVVCSCDAGWVEDENWSPPDPRAYARGRYDRSAGDGLILCGFCGGDGVRWTEIERVDGTPRAWEGDLSDPLCGAPGPDGQRCEFVPGHDGPHGVWEMD